MASFNITLLIFCTLLVGQVLCRKEEVRAVECVANTVECFSHKIHGETCVKLKCLSGVISLTVDSPDATYVSIEAVNNHVNRAPLPDPDCAKTKTVSTSGGPAVAQPPSPVLESPSQYDPNADYMSFLLGHKNARGFDYDQQPVSDPVLSLPTKRVITEWSAGHGKCQADVDPATLLDSKGTGYCRGPVFVVVTEHLPVDGIIDLVTKTCLMLSCCVSVEDPLPANFIPGVPKGKTAQCRTTDYSLNIEQKNDQYKVTIEKVYSSVPNYDNQVDWQVQQVKYSRDIIVENGKVTRGSPAEDIGAELKPVCTATRRLYELWTDVVVEIDLAEQRDELSVSAAVEFCVNTNAVAAAAPPVSEPGCRKANSCEPCY